MAAVTPAFAQPRRLRDPRIERLIAAMTLEEKAGQLSIFGDPVRGPGQAINPGEVVQGLDEVKARIRRGALTGLYNGIGVAIGREMQRVLRRGDPPPDPADLRRRHHPRDADPVSHSAGGSGELRSLAGRAHRARCRAGGDRARRPIGRSRPWSTSRATSAGAASPRPAARIAGWGCRFAEARVRGFQGRRPPKRAHDARLPEAFRRLWRGPGRDGVQHRRHPETTLRETHLPPFKAAFDAGALSTMSSFNDIGGVPATANRHLLTDILRGEWGFSGLVVSDYTSDAELIAHGYAADGADAVAKAIVAGCDISMQSDLYNHHLPELVRSGRVPLAVVDEAVRRVLAVKAALGLFDDPYPLARPRARDRRHPPPRHRRARTRSRAQVAGSAQEPGRTASARQKPKHRADRPGRVRPGRSGGTLGGFPGHGVARHDRGGLPRCARERRAAHGRPRR